MRAAGLCHPRQACVACSAQYIPLGGASHPVSPTGINVLLYCDTAANTDSQVYLDRAVLVIGDRPRNAA